MTGLGYFRGDLVDDQTSPKDPEIFQVIFFLWIAELLVHFISYLT